MINIVCGKKNQEYEGVRVMVKLLKQDDVFPHFISQIQNEISVYNND
jgi:transposase-like protein